MDKAEYGQQESQLRQEMNAARQEYEAAATNYRDAAVLYAAISDSPDGSHLLSRAIASLKRAIYVYKAAVEAYSSLRHGEVLGPRLVMRRR